MKSVMSIKYNVLTGTIEASHAKSGFSTATPEIFNRVVGTFFSVNSRSRLVATKPKSKCDFFTTDAHAIVMNGLPAIRGAFRTHTAKVNLDKVEYVHLEFYVIVAQDTWARCGVCGSEMSAASLIKHKRNANCYRDYYNGNSRPMWRLNAAEGPWAEVAAVLQQTGLITWSPIRYVPMVSEEVAQAAEKSVEMSNGWMTPSTILPKLLAGMKVAAPAAVPPTTKSFIRKDYHLSYDELLMGDSDGKSKP